VRREDLVLVAINKRLEDTLDMRANRSRIRGAIVIPCGRARTERKAHQQQNNPHTPQHIITS
jgi:hypothetical protein